MVRDAVYQGGMCPRCEGMGSVTDFDLTALYDDTKSLNEGALTIPGYSMDGWYGRIFSGSGFFDLDKPIRKFTKKELHDLLYKEPTKIKVEGINLTYEGLIPQDPEVDAVQGRRRDAAARPRVRGAGGHLHRPAPSATAPGSARRPGPRRSRARTSPTSARCRSATWPTGSADLDEPSVAPLLAGLQHLLDSFAEIGLGYLSLDRPAGTLSGGEAQRTKMIRHLGSSLTDVTYVFDEPTIGLHPHDIERMNDLLLQLRDKGNTVLVVEHKPETIAIADHVVDLGPGAGTAGGTVCFEGTVEGLRGSDTITGRHLDDRATLKDVGAYVRPARWRSAARRPTTCRDVDVDIPLGVLCVVTGVAGSGKSSLIHGSVAGRDGVVVDRPGRDPRLATEQPGDVHRAARPDPQGVREGQRREAGAVQLQLRGRLPRPATAPASSTPSWASWPPSSPPARSARGSGSRRRCWSTRSAAGTSAEVLAMSVTEAEEFFGAGEARTPAAHKILDRLADVGLGYLTLGQPLTTLSGGERQRLKLATQMAEKGDVYVLDEPTTGLHLADVEQLLGLLDRLVDSGKSVIVIEHHQAVMAHADWIIDLGPGAGHDGGRIVFEGTPADLVAARSTLTGEHLAAYVGA